MVIKNDTFGKSSEISEHMNQANRRLISVSACPKGSPHFHAFWEEDE